MATGGLALNRRLQQLLPGVITKEYRDMLYYDGTIVPTIADLKAGAASVIRIGLNEIGSAEFAQQVSKDIPLADAKAFEDEYKVVYVYSGYSIEFSQERAYQFDTTIGFDRILKQKQEAAKRAIAEKVQKYTAFGDPRLTSFGFNNNPNVIVEDNSDNLYLLTGKELYEYFVSLKFRGQVAANYTDFGDIALVSPQIFNLLRVTLMASNESSVLSKLVTKQDGEDAAIYKSIKPVPELLYSQLEANGVEILGTNKDRIILYPYDADVVERHVEPVQLFPQQYFQTVGTVRVFPMFMTLTPTIVNRPTQMRYIKVAKKAGT